MATRLTNLAVNRVALVPAGANFDKTTGDGAHIMLFKMHEPVEKKIVHRGNEWCVTSEDGSKTLGCHTTRAAAVRQLAAVEMNKQADLVNILCLKAEEMAQTFDEIEAHREFREHINEKIYTFQDSIWSILNDPDVDQMAMIQQTVAEFSAAVLGGLAKIVNKAGRKISATRMKQLRSALSALQSIIAEQEDGSMPEKKTQKSVTPDKEAILKALPEEHVEQVSQLLADIEKANKEFQESLKKAQDDLVVAQAKVTELEKAQSTDPTEEDVLKGIPEAVRKRLEDAEAKAAEAEAVAKAEREARQVQEFTKQAETDLSHLPGEAIAKGKLLKSVYEKLEKAEADELLTLLKAGSEAMFQALKISGSDEKPSGNSAYDRLEAIAAKMREADPKLSKEQAFAKATEEHTDLYGEHLKERRLSA